MTESARPETLIRHLVEGMASETGRAFFHALVRSAAMAMSVAGAWVTEYLPERNVLRSIAFWLNGGFVEDYEYKICGTPCEQVIERACLVHYPDRIIELFPDDPELVELGAVSYAGVPLLKADGTVLGHLSVFDTKPLVLAADLESTFRIFAARAAAELNRIRAESAVRDSEQRYSRLFESAMDAIFELDRRFRILRANTSAATLFNMPVERRAAYYREMRHLRSLPHNDEMLHIVYILHFPMLMMVEIPQRLAMEREKLERATGECMVVLQRTNERLARLTEEVAGGISAEAIAEKINESLRQQFLKSTIPQTGQALTVVAGEIKQAVAGLEQGTTKIVAAHRHAAHEALRAVREMKSAISEVTTTARQATAELASTYLHEYRWALGMLLVLAVVLGFLFGIFLEGSGYLPSFEPTHETAPAAIPRTRR